jgi:hypothetical protein
MRKPPQTIVHSPGINVLAFHQVPVQQTHWLKRKLIIWINHSNKIPICIFNCQFLLTVLPHWAQVSRGSMIHVQSDLTDAVPETTFQDFAFHHQLPNHHGILIFSGLTKVTYHCDGTSAKNIFHQTIQFTATSKLICSDSYIGKILPE